MKKSLLVLAFSLPFILLWPATAYGCLCSLSPEALTPEQAKAALLKNFNGTTAIFYGEVVEVNRLKAKFKVEKIWKGEATDEITMSLRGKDENGKYVFTSCDVEFKKGVRYLVFAYDGADGLRTHVCSGTSDFKDYILPQMNKLDEIKLPEIRNQKTEP